MATLLTEAERRYLAAVLDNPDLTIEQIQGRDFAHPGYAAVYQAVFDLHQEQPDLAGADLTRVAADRAGALGLDADRLEQLRADAPEAEHVEFYAGMVLDGSFQREIGAYAQTALASGEDVDEHSQRVNAAIARHAEHYQQLFNTPWPDQATAAEAPEAATRTGHEELLVASLMAYPEQVRDLVAIAPPESIEDFRCRAAYEAVASAAWDGDPISDLDLVWQITKAQDMHANLEGPPVSYTEPDAAFIARLGRTDVTEHTGIETARASSRRRPNHRYREPAPDTPGRADHQPGLRLRQPDSGQPSRTARTTPPARPHAAPGICGGKPMNTRPTPRNTADQTGLPKVITAAEMRRHWLHAEVRPISPLLDMTVEYAGHWWNLDGNDAWVRATDPVAIAKYEAQKQRSAALHEQLRKKTDRNHQRKLLRHRLT